MKRVDVNFNLTTAYHPQYDGQCERVNQCLENYLRCMTSNRPKQWVKWLSLAQWWYNTNSHASLKTTPFEALFGYALPHLPLGTPPNSHVAAVAELIKGKHGFWPRQPSQDRMKRYEDKERS